MGLDTKQNPILYSIGTHLAYKIPESVSLASN